MPDPYLLYYLALAATAATSGGMASLLWLKAGNAAEVRPLVLFCIGVAVWVSGHLLINTCDGTCLRAGQALVNISPLVAACFLHFSISFTSDIKRNHLALIYISAAAVSIVAIISNAGGPVPWLGFRHFYRFDFYALIVITVTASLGVIGHIYLFLKGLKAEHRKQKQIVAVFLAGAWGLLSASGFLMGSVGLPLFPYPVLLLPGYTLFLVYGILRYEFMDVNLWVRKSLEWGIVLAAMLVAISLVVTILIRLGLSNISLTIWQIWFISLAALVLAVLTHRPATELATRLVYPGSWIDSTLLKKWQIDLDGARSWSELSKLAGKLISIHLGNSISVAVSPHFTQPASPGLVCYRSTEGWSYTLTGWDTAAPGVARSAEVFATILVASAGRLEQAMNIAEREMEMLKESHLTELGRLSATVAHEMRNPLNIISMASASCDSEAKKEISDQLERAGRLINDLLAYSGKIKIERKSLNLREEVDYVLSHYDSPRPQGEGQGEGGIGALKVSLVNDVLPKLSVSSDTHRLHQVFFNLLDNAFAALKGIDSGRIFICAEQKDGQIKVSVCDNGLGIPENIKEAIFQPFISGRTGGTGLGLAIVRRIMEAHGGRIELVAKDGWGCCFELYFPKEEFK